MVTASRAKRTRLLAMLLALTGIMLLVGTARAELDLPMPTTYVVDRADVIDAATAYEIENLLRRLEKRTTAQVIVLTVESTEGEDWFSFVQRTAERWQLGVKGKDNGVLIALSVDDRQVRIHPGYGLEGALPDGWCGSASREARDKHFRDGRYSAGMELLARMVAGRIAHEAGVKLDGGVEFEPPAQAPGA